MSKINPYLRGSRISRPTVESLANTTKPNSNQSYVNRDGNFNAASIQDLANLITAAKTEMNQGSIRTSGAQRRKEAVAKIMSEHGDVVHEALASSSSSKSASFETLAAVVTDVIKTAGDREGLAANLLASKELKQGDTARWQVKEKQVVGFQAFTLTKIAPSYVRQGYAYPEEFDIPVNIRISHKEIAQNPGDILEEKLAEGQEQTMVVEDRIMRDGWVASASLVNEPFYFNSFNPTTFQSLKTQIGTWSLTPGAAVMAHNIWDDIVGDPEFSNWFDQVSKHELVVNGTLPAILGVPLITDGFREAHLKVLNQGEVFMVAQPDEVGGMTGRGEQIIEPISGAPQGEAWKGWFFNRIRSIQIINARGIVRATRLS